MNLGALGVMYKPSEQARECQKHLVLAIFEASAPELMTHLQLEFQ